MITDRAAGTDDESSIPALAAAFTGFAEHRAGSYAPFTAALARRIAAEPTLLAAAAAARPGQSRPDLLLACLHSLALDLADTSPGHPVATAYSHAGAQPRIAGEPATAAVGPGLPPCADELDAEADDVVAFALDHHVTLTELVGSRTVQTNEVGRAAFLYPGLLVARAHAHGRRLALIEIGASAGLNLLLDQYRITYRRGSDLPGHQSAGDDEPTLSADTAEGNAALIVDPDPQGASRPDEVPQVQCTLLGSARPRLGPPLHTGAGVGTRVGLDLYPLDPRRPEDRRWLRALVWPEHNARRARLDQALRLAAGHPAVTAGSYPLVTTGDAAAELAPLLDTVADDEHPVVMHTAVLAHMTSTHRATFTRALLEASHTRAISWLAAEPRPDRDPRRLRLALVRGGQIVEEQALAAYHPHGATLSWVAQSRVDQDGDASAATR